MCLDNVCMLEGGMFSNVHMHEKGELRNVCMLERDESSNVHVRKG